MKKIVELKDNDKLMINVSNGYFSEVITITKVNMEKDEIIKDINFSITDDIYFNTTSYLDDEKDYVEFDFNIDNPLYYSLNRLLGKSEELILDDDLTSESLIKYLILKRIDNNIKIIFYNKDKDAMEYEKYGVFIKNILPDGRSKITDNNIKYRLIDFFRETREMLMENHQYSLDEYYEWLNKDNNRNIYNPFLKNYDKKRNANEFCANCQYNISRELQTEIIKNNYKYQNMDEEEVRKLIGICEYKVTKEYQLKNNFWCPKYEEIQKVKSYYRRNIWEKEA